MLVVASIVDDRYKLLKFLLTLRRTLSLARLLTLYRGIMFFLLITPTNRLSGPLRFLIEPTIRYNVYR
jgi:hypothetical protein